MKNIFCIDDEPLVLSTIKSLLEDGGHYEVRTFAKASEILEALQEERPDGLLLDMYMPDMSGVQLLKEIQKNPALKTIPVGFITAATREENLEEYRELGVRGIVAKPIHPGALLYQVGLIFSDTLTSSHL